jgi:acetoin utilization deacetylase AcuC-like enzyme
MWIIYDEMFVLHSAGSSHPESSSRLVRIMEKLYKLKSAKNLKFIKPVMADEDIVFLVHDKQYYEKIKKISLDGNPFYIDPDTMVSEHTFACARLAALACITGIDSMFVCKDSMRREADEREDNGNRNFFAIVRPPGHHAFRDRGSGFCIFNNIAIAAKYALKKYGIKRIAIIDFDVHHGNGTQEIFYEEPDVFYVSIHQYPHYPGTGYYTETGEGAGRGFNLNIPVVPFSEEADYIPAFLGIILPVLKNYAPQLILVSAGYDGHKNDLLSDNRLDSSSYYKLALVIKMIGYMCGSKIGLVLEGGYNIDTLGDSVLETIRGINEPVTSKKIPGLMKDIINSSGQENRQNHDTFMKIKEMFIG